MSEINLPPFYVGQKVVRVQTESQNLLTIGMQYVVSDIKYCCSKWGWRISLSGISYRHGTCECGRADNLDWAAKNFAPVQENFQSISIEKVIEKETPLVCVN